MCQTQSNVYIFTKSGYNVMYNKILYDECFLFSVLVTNVEKSKFNKFHSVFDYVSTFKQHN